MCIRWLAYWLALLFALSPDLRASWDFDTITSRSQSLYGPMTPATRRNIDEWKELVSSYSGGTIKDKLNRVNHFFNSHIRFRSDMAVWGQDDYWATPMELLWKGAGDCEDYALAKYFTLIEMGVPASQLRITYVKALEVNQAHMVLAWYATPDAIPLILDNFKPRILLSTQRKDLLPVYSFNGKGLWIPQGGKNKRVGDSKKISRWQDLLTKMRAEGFVINQ